MSYTVYTLDGNSVLTRSASLTRKLIVSNFGTSPFALFAKGGYNPIPHTAALPLPGVSMYYLVPIERDNKYDTDLYKALMLSSFDDITESISPNRSYGAQTRMLYYLEGCSLYTDVVTWANQTRCLL